MSETHKAFATRAADRVDADEVGIDPTIIITIITTLLPLLIGCFSREDESDPESIKSAVKERNERNPDQLRRRMAHRIRRDSTERIDRQQANALADAVIEQILEEDDAVVVAGCLEVGE